MDGHHTKIPMPIFKVSECNKIRSFGLTRKICIKTINDLFWKIYQESYQLATMTQNFGNYLLQRSKPKKSIENISIKKLENKKYVYNLSNCNMNCVILLLS